MRFCIIVPATLGYVLAMQYNQNNAAPEGGPLTSWVEWKVGQQLCKMIGFEIRNDGEEDNNDDDDGEKIFGWGQLTAGGTLANLQSMWCVLIFLFPALSTVVYRHLSVYSVRIGTYSESLLWHQNLII